ncbi:PREDICTED: protein NPC2 homolog [Atta cephalotes]|uniref:MD-2-related lipid-recognition domain-containing protein n=1 Tax=Atta cephalotes TaxID=12957 RepID=A0A158NIY6_ATTCE|nr:PREDICTED: protein NPC2 homolog [Atta cephalotes]
MNPVEKVYGSGWAAWWRKHSIALQIGTTISCNIAYLADSGHTRKAVTLSMILLDADVEKLIVFVKVTILGMTITYPYPYPNACESLTNSKCPLSKGDNVTYNLVMPISKNYPSIEMTIEFSLNDEKNNSQVCFKLDGQVTDK